MITITPAPRLWPDSTIACVATGPSLTQSDCEYIRGKVRVVAVNDAHLLCPWADVLYSSDRHWWPFHKGVPKFQGMRYGIGSAPKKANPFWSYPDIHVLRNDGYHGLSLDPSGLRNGKNSGYAAINLARHFGATRILLLGYNLCYLHGRAHFFGNHSPRLQQTQALYPNFIRAFDTLVEPLKEQGIAVVNCTPQTSLECFPVANLRDVLPESLAVAS